LRRWLCSLSLGLQPQEESGERAALSRIIEKIPPVVLCSPIHRAWLRSAGTLSPRARDASGSGAAALADESLYPRARVMQVRDVERGRHGVRPATVGTLGYAAAPCKQGF